MKQVFYCIIQTFKLKLPDLENINPIQAGVFSNHIDWGGDIVSPSVSHFLRFNYNQTWHDGTLGQNLSKAVKYFADIITRR